MWMHTERERDMKERGRERENTEFSQKALSIKSPSISSEKTGKCSGQEGTVWSGSLICGRERRVNGRKDMNSMCSSVVSCKESNISSEPANLLLGLIQHAQLMLGLTRYVAEIKARTPLTKCLGKRYFYKFKTRENRKTENTHCQQ